MNAGRASAWDLSPMPFPKCARAAAEGGRPPDDLEKRRAEFDAWARRVGWRA